MNIKKVDHIGIAVNSIEDKLKLYKNVLGLRLSDVVVLKDRGLKVYFMEIGDDKLELLEPISSDSEITKFLEKKGEGIHHIAFSVSSIEEVVKNCEENGFKVISEVKEGAEGKKVAFLHPKSTGGVLIELVEDSSMQVKE